MRAGMLETMCIGGGQGLALGLRGRATTAVVHEAQQRTAALIGAVVIDSVWQRFSSESRSPGSKEERRARCHSDETTNCNLQIRVDGDCATERSASTLKCDRSLRQTLDDMTSDKLHHRSSGKRRMTPGLGTYVCHERGREFCL